MLRKKELQWFYQEGASRIFPDAWEDFIAIIPVAERRDLLKAYYERLISVDRDRRIEAARSWSVWEGRTSRLVPDPTIADRFGDAHFAEAFARIEAHYFVNGGFFHSETTLLEHTKRLRTVPGVIVHGRYDVVCPVENAWELSKAWPEAKLIIVPEAGHSAHEDGITSELVRATDSFR